MWPGRQMVVLIPKKYLFRVFCAVFSGTAHELMVPAYAPNTHPRPHRIQNKPTDLLNFSSRCTILDVPKVTLYYRIDTVIQLFHWLNKWSLAQWLYKTLCPLVLYQIEPEISTPEKLAFVLSLGVTLNPCISATNQNFEKI